jgi:hypothetical protein
MITTLSPGFMRAAFIAQKNPAAPPPITVSCFDKSQFLTMKNEIYEDRFTMITGKIKKQINEPGQVF